MKQLLIILLAVVTNSVWAGEESERQSENTKAGEFVKIPGGTLDLSGKSVTIAPFEMGKYEITQAQWQKIMGNNPSYKKGCQKCPVQNVKWSEVQEFIKKLHTETGVDYRLPTVVEWEFVCGGGHQCRASNLLATYSSAGNSITYPAGEKPPNNSGVYNIDDNVWEWTCSVYSARYNGNELVCEDSDKYATHAIRGGKNTNLSIQVRDAVTTLNAYNIRTPTLGFRLVIDK